MVFKHVAEATGSLEKANANLQAELLSADAAKELLAAYARAEKLASFGKTVLARRVEDAAEVARATGTSVGKAKATVDTGKVLGDSDDVRDAFQTGNISLDQSSCRGAITFLLPHGKQGKPSNGTCNPEHHNLSYSDEAGSGTTDFLRIRSLGLKQTP